jgi:hypothetical protein
MRQFSPIIIIFIFGFVACTDSGNVNPPEKELPKAPGNKTISKIPTSSRDGDLVNNIYNELLKDSPDLKEVENQISLLRRSTGDSLLPFQEFDSKNRQYYLSAGNQLATVKDSALRGMIKKLLDSSSRNYQASVGKHNELRETVDFKSSTLSDLHILLKISTTIPIIEDYQKKNIPSTESMDKLIKDYNRVIEKTKSITKSAKAS